MRVVNGMGAVAQSLTPALHPNLGYSGELHVALIPIWAIHLWFGLLDPHESLPTQIFCDLIPEFWKQRVARKHKWSPAHGHTMYLHSWLFSTPPLKPPSSRVREHLAFGREGSLSERAPEFPRHQVSSSSRHRAAQFPELLNSHLSLPILPPFNFSPSLTRHDLGGRMNTLNQKGKENKCSLVPPPVSCPEFITCTVPDSDVPSHRERSTNTTSRQRHVRRNKKTTTAFLYPLLQSCRPSFFFFFVKVILPQHGH